MRRSTLFRYKSGAALLAPEKYTQIGDKLATWRRRGGPRLHDRAR